MNTAQVIQFPQSFNAPVQQGARKSMYSDKFSQGYVMSSLLYRREVRPFLSDAARNVYAELEDRINGYNKESDFVSYSQLQGGDLLGSRQLSRKTVSEGLKELLKLGVITVVANGKQGMKAYQINEVSLKDKFTNKTSSVSKPVPLVNQDQFPKGTETSSASEHTIDSLDIRLEEDRSAQQEALFVAQNRSLNFVQYHTADRQAISLPELAKKYPVQIDFQEQAKISFPNHSPERIFEELKKLVQWSLSASNHMPQKWMSIWLNWMQKVPTDAELEKQQARKAKTTARPKTERNVNQAWGNEQTYAPANDIDTGDML